MHVFENHIDFWIVSFGVFKKGLDGFGVAIEIVLRKLIID
jgi:hypothetical protein